jgi:triosephosphate isomerase
MTRRPLFVGVSLKLYLDVHATLDWCEQVADLAEREPGIGAGDVELVVLPTFETLVPARSILSRAGVMLGAQDLFWNDEGAYTGEVSGRSLSQVGARYVIVGHAERRRLFGDTDERVALKVSAAVRNGLVPILCVGELEPDGGEDTAVDAANFCIAQLESALAGVTDDARLAGDARGTGDAEGSDGIELIVAYEPVWAIGAEAPAPIDHILGVCSRLRGWLDERPGLASARVVYGGSARTGLLRDSSSVLDGIFLGRFAHDPENLGRMLREAAEVSTRTSVPR